MAVVDAGRAGPRVCIKACAFCVVVEPVAAAPAVPAAAVPAPAVAPAGFLFSPLRLAARRGVGFELPSFLSLFF